MAFNFLALPREIRDLIYAYIVGDVKYRHALIGAGPRQKYGNVVRVTVEGVPLLSLLLAHSRLYDEYKYATRAHKRSAQIRLDTLIKLSGNALIARAYNL